MKPPGAPRGGHGDDRGGERDATLLGEVLALGPRLASRTVAQIQASQQLLAMLNCARGNDGGPTERSSTHVDHTLAEPVDVLAVLDDGAADVPGEQDAPTDKAHPPHTVDGPQEHPVDIPAAEDLAIPGYDSLAASQVVPRLTTLGSEELKAIETYEAGNRARRTILNRVRQLRASADGDD